MFIIIGEKRCPNCGVLGKSWDKKLKIFVCPACNTIFNEFGFITTGAEKETLIS